MHFIDDHAAPPPCQQCLRCHHPRIRGFVRPAQETTAGDYDVYKSSRHALYQPLTALTAASGSQYLYLEGSPPTELPGPVSH
mmetsp:Transcript_103819/g.247150  ORF Transcript_103819/g.247150 Transcript_103819/m.247150 type:complete len:82 (+) Transcript_103819:348-593(+)